MLRDHLKTVDRQHFALVSAAIFLFHCYRPFLEKGVCSLWLFQAADGDPKAESAIWQRRMRPHGKLSTCMRRNVSRCLSNFSRDLSGCATTKPRRGACACVCWGQRLGTFYLSISIAETNASRKMDEAACMQVEVECLAAEKQFLLSENRTLTNKNVRPLPYISAFLQDALKIQEEHFPIILRWGFHSLARLWVKPNCGGHKTDWVSYLFFSYPLQTNYPIPFGFSWVSPKRVSSLLLKPRKYFLHYRLTERSTKLTFKGMLTLCDFSSLAVFDSHTWLRFSLWLACIGKITYC